MRLLRLKLNGARTAEGFAAHHHNAATKDGRVTLDLTSAERGMGQKRVHHDSDQIALDAESLKEVSHSFNRLSNTLRTCVSCHATHQIQTPHRADSR